MKQCYVLYVFLYSYEISRGDIVGHFDKFPLKGKFASGLMILYIEIMAGPPFGAKTLFWTNVGLLDLDIRLGLCSPWSKLYWPHLPEGVRVNPLWPQQWCDTWYQNLVIINWTTCRHYLNYRFYATAIKIKVIPIWEIILKITYACLINFVLGPVSQWWSFTPAQHDLGWEICQSDHS